MARGAWGIMQQGCLSALAGKASDAVQTITSGVTALRATRTTMWMPLWLSYLARANAELGQFDNARRCIGEAMTAAEVVRRRELPVHGTVKFFKEDRIRLYRTRRPRHRSVRSHQSMR
jgi:hypothetical protein